MDKVTGDSEGTNSDEGEAGGLMKNKEISTKREEFLAKKRWPKTGIWGGEVKM
jgi:hypothetical protein